MRSLVLVGEGSLTRGQAAQALYHWAELARQLEIFQDVQVCFVLEEPTLRQALRLVATTDVTIIPVLPAGPVTQLTETIIPRELGLGHQGPVPPEGIARVLGGKTVRYLPALNLPAVSAAQASNDQTSDTQTSDEQARQALWQLATQVRAGGDMAREQQAAWQELQQQARQGLRLGEVLVAPHGPLYELRHMLDEGRPAAELTTFVTPDGLREATSTAANGTYRPVRTLRNLPRGWRAVCSHAELPAHLHTLYPGATEEAYAYGCHNLHRTPWATTARRCAPGNPALPQVTADQLEQTARQLCSGCIRTRLWADEPLSRTFLEGVPGALPCPEACPLFVATVSSLNK